MQGYDAVGQLSFPRISEVPVDRQGQNSYIELTDRCDSIVELALMFRPEVLLCVSHVEPWRMSEHPRGINPGDLALVPVEAIVQRYSLSSLRL